MESISLPVNRSVDLVHDPEKAKKSQRQHEDRIFVVQLLIQQVAQPTRYADREQQLQAKPAIPKVIVIPTWLLAGMGGFAFERHYQLF